MGKEIAFSCHWVTDVHDVCMSTDSLSPRVVLLFAEMSREHEAHVLQSLSLTTRFDETLEAELFDGMRSQTPVLGQVLAAQLAYESPSNHCISCSQLDQLFQATDISSSPASKTSRDAASA